MGLRKIGYRFRMVVKDDGENQRIFAAEKVAPVKKTDWIAVALVGVLLLVAAMPSGGYGKYLAESKKKGTAQEKTEQKYEKEDYAEYL